MKIAEKHDTHQAYIELARIFSSVKIMGPPVNQKLIKLISHLYSPEEADICQHLSFIFPKTAVHIARKLGKHPDEITFKLKAMSERRVIHAYNENRFMLYPLIPGTFEYILMTGENSKWHQDYAELITDLFSTGYIREYLARQVNAIRNIPVQQAIEDKNIIADADIISEMIDSHSNFAMLHACACRHAMRITGRECQRATPEEGCLIFGDFSLVTVARGNGRAVSKSEMRDIVEERFDKKLVFLTSNVAPSVPNVICTCCECCCHALKVYNSFSKKFLAPSHFVADVDEQLCDNCGRCVKACNTMAHAINDKRHVYDSANCIGCGYCSKVCKNNAIKMIENLSYKPPSKSYINLLFKMLPPITLMGTKIKFSRYLENFNSR